MLSLRIMKNDAERHARARGQRAHAVAHDDAVGASGAGDRTFARREDDRGALLNRNRVAARLRARTLLDGETRRRCSPRRGG